MKTNKKKEFIKFLNEAKGIISYACDKIGISRQTYYNWLQNDKKFAEEVEVCSERTIDLVESKLLSAISNDDITAIIFYLRTKGKKRGYVEKTEREFNINAFEKLMQDVEDE